ncbi:uncharacterized protein MYCFIDRAFT_209129 [Pseudocercospora fijiensis CIRAD86]|uniref:Uncharacterized protein n=1 Tax=Pseudocercospora fijiensis (strain CIRAD86) TaxID=383855 RepID=M3AJE6_PSEFD|nr:uncharacterized protein MYCFIDRAFT_209129 [Pseudocercospora fijiensis CIRAD86]EME77602.1 hypothetical protein MYCFIDRAFT_209129 [Pseudocercospora fijiensis CIRAD86]
MLPMIQWYGTYNLSIDSSGINRHNDQKTKRSRQIANMLFRKSPLPNMQLSELLTPCGRCYGGGATRLLV